MQLMLLQLDNPQTLTIFDEQTNKAISDGRVSERSERVFTEIFIPCYLVAIFAGPNPGSHHVVAYLSMQICGFSWLSAFLCFRLSSFYPMDWSSATTRSESKQPPLSRMENLGPISCCHRWSIGARHGQVGDSHRYIGTTSTAQVSMESFGGEMCDVEWSLNIGM